MKKNASMPLFDKNSKAGQIITPVVKPMRVLWNEVIGFLFCVLGVIMGGQAIRSFRRTGELDLSPVNIFLHFFLPALMLFFGVTSFLRARKISRS
jgi:hypothetical protein